MHVSVWILNICLVSPNSLSLGVSAQIQVSEGGSGWVRVPVAVSGWF